MTSLGSGSRGSDRVIVLDRDGTLVIDRGYLDDPAGLEWTPGAAEAVRWWHEHDYRLIVITNQSGVGRGLFTLERLAAVHARLEAMMAAAGAPLTALYVCTHRPEDGCLCRKPQVSLLEQAAREHAFDVRRCVVIGDKASDVELGRRVGARTIRIAAPGAIAPPDAAEEPAPDLTVQTLLEAAHAVTDRGW